MFSEKRLDFNSDRIYGGGSSDNTINPEIKERKEECV